MEQEKTPGSAYLVTSINYAYQKRQFSVTRRQGIIEIIPKKDAEPFLIKNYYFT